MRTKLEALDARPASRLAEQSPAQVGAVDARAAGQPFQLAAPAARLEADAPVPRAEAAVLLAWRRLASAAAEVDAGLGAVVALVDVLHPRQLLGMVVDVDRDGAVGGEQRCVVEHVAEERLGVHVAKVVHHARRDGVRRATLSRRVPHLLVVRRLVPHALGLHPPLEADHHGEHLVSGLQKEEARVARREPQIGGRAVVPQVAVRGDVVPAVGHALDVHIAIERR
mmetsp:Transcript_92302/g.276961  ORF Transcript_92302/g.276961 Transcript_92302/m.276961 type:complete len:225 (-) Transcript_92302:398-1072(-)|eukprot:5665525-Prymnesium_polylepis.1